MRIFVQGQLPKVLFVYRYGGLSAEPFIRMARPSASRSSSLEKAPRLVGQLNSEGIISLEKDSSPLSSKPPRSLKVALEAATSSRGLSRTSSETGSDEDYDALKHDPATVVRGGKGGGFAVDDGRNLSGGAANGSTYQALKSASKSRPNPGPLRSM